MKYEECHAGVIRQKEDHLQAQKGKKTNKKNPIHVQHAGQFNNTSL